MRDVVEKGSIKVEKFSTCENPADMMTKDLPVTKFAYCKLEGLHGTCI